MNLQRPCQPQAGTAWKDIGPVPWSRYLCQSPPKQRFIAATYSANPSFDEMSLLEKENRTKQRAACSPCGLVSNSLATGSNRSVWWRFPHWECLAMGGCSYFRVSSQSRPSPRKIRPRSSVNSALSHQPSLLSLSNKCVNEIW